MGARSPRTRSWPRSRARSARRSRFMLDVKIYNSPEKSTWCPGCGDFGILNAVKQALAMLEIHPHECIVVSGIGCGSKLDRKSTRLNSSHANISYAVFCLKKKKK